mmetsp:Transcript_12306/g.31174  ORF Transcript_12306/g.31174 Transcript_12306/m.31174 type:complete len:217 (+) Transcript_12306:174-824(+)
MKSSSPLPAPPSSLSWTPKPEMKVAMSATSLPTPGGSVTSRSLSPVATFVTRSFSGPFFMLLPPPPPPSSPLPTTSARTMAVAAPPSPPVSAPTPGPPITSTSTSLSFSSPSSSSSSSSSGRSRSATNPSAYRSRLSTSSKYCSNPSTDLSSSKGGISSGMDPDLRLSRALVIAAMLTPSRLKGYAQSLKPICSSSCSDNMGLFPPSSMFAKTGTP